MTKKLMTPIFALVFLLAACGPAATTSPDTLMESDVPTSDSMVNEDTSSSDHTIATATQDDMMAESTPSDGMTDTMMDVPEWFNTSLKDAATGMDFSIAGFQGKVVLVETLAMWCSNCRAQQGQVADLLNMLGMRDDFVAVGLDIDQNEKFGDLQTYVAKYGFHWYYAIATPYVASQIGSLYGDLFLNPPSTPILIVDRHGEVHPLPFGIKSASDLLGYIQPFLDEGM